MLYHFCFSPTGGTRRAAEILIHALQEENVFIDLCDPAFQGLALTSQDVAVISVPSYGGRVPCTATQRMQAVQGNGAKAVLVCVYGNRAYDNTLAEMKDQAEKAGFQPIAAVAALAEHSMARKLAAGRPDAEDRLHLEKMAEQIKAKLESRDCTSVTVPGTVPDKPMGNFGGMMAPKATADCTKCGICAEQCPTQAIDPETLEADKTKCIGCMRCIAVCPTQARKLNMVIESLGGVALSVLCSNRKENELFL